MEEKKLEQPTVRHSGVQLTARADSGTVAV